LRHGSNLREATQTLKTGHRAPCVEFVFSMILGAVRPSVSFGRRREPIAQFISHSLGAASQGISSFFTARRSEEHADGNASSDAGQKRQRVTERMILFLAANHARDAVYVFGSSIVRLSSLLPKVIHTIRHLVPKRVNPLRFQQGKPGTQQEF
jgi:hypothetical protein